MCASLKSIRKSEKDNWLAGVCGGLGEHTSVPAWLWRFGFVVLTCLGFAGILVYILLALLMPKPGHDRHADEDDD